MKKISSYTNKMIHKALFFLVVAIFTSTVAIAQFDEPPAPGEEGTNAGDPGTESTSVPIDGGLSILVAAGIGYGAKRLHNQRKKEAEEKQRIRNQKTEC